VSEFIHRLPEHGVLLVLVAVLLEQAGAPLPSFTVLLAAGALAASGQVSAVSALGAAVGAALAANLLWYAAGLRYGQRVMRLLCRVSLSPDTCVRMTETIFQRWGLATLLVSKFVPGISLVAAPVAGAVRMPFPRFFLAALAGALLWAGTYLALGYAFSEQIGMLLEAGSRHVHRALRLLAALFLLYLLYRLVQRQRIARGAGVSRIGPDELRLLLAGAAPPVILDMRSALMRQGHGGIPGALAIELDELKRAAPPLPRDRDIITYCACPNDVSAVRAAQSLGSQGYLRVKVLTGGVEAWQAAGGRLEAAAGAEIKGRDPGPGTTGPGEKRAV
jgi:membrane protein DedA with SNARE-associated domain/rhodanese-related sulfurtransferase